MSRTSPHGESGAGRTRRYAHQVDFASLVGLARTQYQRKPVRYVLVSVIAVAVSQATLLICRLVLDLSPIVSNVTACAVASAPSYLLNRAWVWRRKGGHDVWREVLPFWVIAFIGLGFSTLLVHVASTWSDAALVTNAANLTAYALLWVAKYLVLDQLLFSVVAADEVDEVDDLVTVRS